MHSSHAPHLTWRSNSIKEASNKHDEANSMSSDITLHDFWTNEETKFSQVTFTSRHATSLLLAVLYVDYLVYVLGQLYQQGRVHIFCSEVRHGSDKKKLIAFPCLYSRATPGV